MKNLLAQAVPPPVPIGSTVDVAFGQTKSLSSLIGIILGGSLMIAGIILVFLLIGGGLKVIMSAGGGDAKGSAAGKQAITSALTGFIIVLSAFFIIRLIEIIIGLPFLTFPGF